MLFAVQTELEISTVYIPKTRLFSIYIDYIVSFPSPVSSASYKIKVGQPHPSRKQIFFNNTHTLNVYSSIHAHTPTIL